MFLKLEVQVLYMTLLEVSVSRRQLREVEREARWCPPQGGAPRVWIRETTSQKLGAARSREMEVLDVLQHRTRVKLRKAFEDQVSVPSNVTPYIQSGPRGNEDGGGRTLQELTQGDLPKSSGVVCDPEVGGEEETTTHRRSVEKSDPLIVVMKPGNAGGAKGRTA